MIYIYIYMTYIYIYICIYIYDIYIYIYDIYIYIYDICIYVSIELLPPLPPTPRINRESCHEHTFPCRLGLQGLAALFRCSRSSFWLWPKLFSFCGGGGVGAVRTGGRIAEGGVAGVGAV